MQRIQMHSTSSQTYKGAVLSFCRSFSVHVRIPHISDWHGVRKNGSTAASQPDQQAGDVLQGDDVDHLSNDSE